MTDKQRSYGGKMDPECLRLCNAMNRMPGIRTMESCCGHGKRPFWIFFNADSIEVLAPLLYYFSACHSGESGWQVIVRTDCAASRASFLVEGPAGAFAAADKIAAFIEDEAARWESGELPHKDEGEEDAEPEEPESPVHAI